MPPVCQCDKQAFLQPYSSLFRHVKRVNFFLAEFLENFPPMRPTATRSRPSAVAAPPPPPTLGKELYQLLQLAANGQTRPSSCRAIFSQYALK